MSEMSIGELNSGTISKFIEDTFGVPSVDSKKYAKIAAYLSDKTKFCEHLGKVDSWLSEIFAKANEAGAFANSPQGFNYHDTSKGYNITSRLLNAAANSVGWGTGVNLVLSGFTHQPDFVDFVKKKLMWKDMVASAHGEFTHSIQWLIVYSFMHEEAPVLYAGACDYKGLEGEWKDKYLWDFLVDCFPPAPDTNVNWTTSVQSNSGRSPTIANAWIQEANGFMGQRLKERYGRRRWAPPAYIGGTQTVEHSHQKHLAESGIGGGYKKEGLTSENVRDKRRSFDGKNNYRGLVTTYNGKPKTPDDQKEKKTGIIFKRDDSQLIPNSALMVAVSQCPFPG
ncbi:LirA/MavJ family T4SS effector [Xanthomonas citri pv. bilvae]|uniref:LirA/MavJ family T4SS effector n=1 Tax=Xanthomonas citri TaxID=346 RepID=UPI0005420358|nr:hypothetical protein XAB3213_4280002 [Xanthomonas citri pv. bilvae]